MKLYKYENPTYHGHYKMSKKDARQQAREDGVHSGRIMELHLETTQIHETIANLLNQVADGKQLPIYTKHYKEVGLIK